MAPAAQHSNAALYYPYTHFSSDAWVKLCALYWEELWRIVPTSYATEDSSVVGELVQAGLVKQVDPLSIAPAFSATFVGFLARHGGDLSPRYAVSNRRSWPELPREWRAPVAGRRSLGDDRLAYLYFEKMVPEVRNAIVDLGLGVAHGTDERWIGMHPRLAFVYMTALADRLGGECGLAPLTDVARGHVLTGELKVERLAQALLGDVSLVGTGDIAEVEATAFEIALRMAIPTNIEDVPVERILEFRRKSVAERARFRKYVDDFLGAREWLADVRSRAMLEDRLRSEYETDLAPKVEELRSAMHDAGITTTLGAFAKRFVVPVGASTLARALGLSVDPLLGVVSGAALAVAGVMQDRRKRTKGVLRHSPVAYLFRVEEELSPERLLRWVREESRIFMLG